MLTEEGWLTLIWGQALCKRKLVDPYTEHVTSVVETKTEEKFKELMTKETGIMIDFPLSIKGRDFTGFTD